jgi:hypothetical protein
MSQASMAFFSRVFLTTIILMPALKAARRKSTVFSALSDVVFAS